MTIRIPEDYLQFKITANNEQGYNIVKYDTFTIRGYADYLWARGVRQKWLKRDVIKGGHEYILPHVEGHTADIIKLRT